MKKIRSNWLFNLRLFLKLCWNPIEAKRYLIEHFYPMKEDLEETPNNLQQEIEMLDKCIQSNKDRWEIVNQLKPYDLIFEAAIFEYNKSGELPDMDEVLDKVEAILNSHTLHYWNRKKLALNIIY